MNHKENLCLTPDDRDLLATLSLRVRVLTLSQIASRWPSVVSHLSRLERERLIYSFVAVTHPELRVSSPVVQWSAGDPPPDFSSASYRLRSRWGEPAIPIKCFIAGTSTGRMFGGHGGRYPRESEEAHDIHLAAVFLRFRELQPEQVSSWVHEDELRRERNGRCGKVPDAMVGKARVVECGGAYKTRKLIAFHQFCEARGYKYEVW